MKRTSEKQIAVAIVAVLRKQPGRTATVSELIDLIPTEIKLTKADRATSPSRPAEKVWEQRVRNIRSHNSGERYGLLAVPGGFKLLARPAAAVRHHVETIAREAQL